MRLAVLLVAIAVLFTGCISFRAKEITVIPDEIYVEGNYSDPDNGLNWSGGKVGMKWRLRDR